MLVEVKTVDEGVVRRLTDIYAESMDALEKHFPSRERMLAEYAAFAADFARQENQRILAEDAGNGWVSALRAIEQLGGAVIDCDAVYHEMLEQDEALKERVEFMKQGASYMQEESEPAASNP